MTFGDVIYAILNVRVFDAVVAFLVVVIPFSAYAVWAELHGAYYEKLREKRRLDAIERVGRPLR